ncbi:hypothetical protein [Fodinicola feengrottensis]|uniref:Uncharacterized protein n=1 Tax=Fodinicola feengrottensis TaxID=435914 RepID=A0ABN2FZX9_9ACTN|nr:hypothetical protein [Fodinicola feengrottensis]
MADAEKLLIDGVDQLRFVHLEKFPKSTDFVIELADDGTDSAVRFLAQDLRIVVSFPWWENPKGEIAEWAPADAPNGSTESPYWDMDQGWRILIWQSGDLVYIAEGGAEEGVYANWFSLPAALYQSEWDKVIRLASSAAQ